jgi:hypothetical protein
MSVAVRVRERRTLGLVLSGTQLLNVIEWAHATGQQKDLRVVVLAPKDEPTRRQLERVSWLAGAAGIVVDTIDLHRVAGGVFGEGARLMRDVARAEQLAIGDPFSRLVQSALPFARPDRVVIVDDGTATWQYRDCVQAGRPLVRWDGTRAGSVRAAQATRLLSPGRNRDVTVFSCLADATPVGAFNVVNDYAWTRARSRPEVVTGVVDVIGTSLVESGIVTRSAYLAAIARLAHDYGPIRYLAHRRESAEGLALIATIPGLRVERPSRPVELVLRHGPVASHAIAFPSTAAHTLPIVLQDVPVHLDVRPIDAAWFNPNCAAAARRFVERIANDAPLDLLDAA